LNKKLNSNIYWAFFRFALVIAILYFLVSSDVLDIKKLIIMLKSGWIYIGFICLLITLFFSMLRWKILLSSINLTLRMREIASLTFIGFSLNKLIPGAIFGDIVKSYYLGRGSPNKVKIIMTIVLDRFIGIFTLIFTGALAISGILIFRSDLLKTSEELHNIQVLGFTLFLIVAIIIFVFYFSLSNKFHQYNIIKGLTANMRTHKTFGKLFDIFNLLKYKKRFLLSATCISIIGKIPLILCMYFIGKSTGENDLLFAHYLFLAPVAYTLNAIPFGAGGLGTGEVFVYKLFKLFGSVNGANIIAIFHIATIFFSLIGLILYVFHKKQERI